MTRGRHRLFDAKRRDGWHTYMQGAELYVSQKIPIPKSAVKVYAADWKFLGTQEELEAGAAMTLPGSTWRSLAKQ